jgi:hypothetical protein
VSPIAVAGDEGPASVRVAGRSEASVPYVFLLGASHSGTTLLTLLLNAHPDVATVGELTSGAVRAVGSYRCSCRRPIEQCGFWSRVGAAVRPVHHGFDLETFGIRFEPESPAWLRRLARIEHRGPGLESLRSLAMGLSPTWRRHRADLERACGTIARAVLDLTGARVFVDSSKLAHRLRFLREMTALDLRVIHVVRDGRAVALTYLDQERFADASDPHLRRGGFGADSPWRPESLPLRRAAAEWLRAQRSAEHALACLPRRHWTRVRYEDLCARPRETQAELLTFLGLDPSTAAADFRSVEHHVVGNGMRLDGTSEIRLDERWKSALSARDLADFDAVAGVVNRRYGYS